MGPKVGDVVVGVKVDKQSLTQSFSLLKSSFSQIAVAIGAATAALGVFAAALKRAIELAGEQQEAETLLEQTLRNHGRAVRSLMTDYKEFASELQALTGYGDELILRLIAMFETSGKYTTQQVKTMVQLALDLMAKYKIGWREAFKAVQQYAEGKTGYLTRLGISIDEATAKAATLDERLRLLQEVAGGAAEAMAKTWPGLMRQIQSYWGDILEKIGGVFLQSKAWREVIQRIISFLRNLSQSMGRLGELWQTVANIAGEFINVVMDLGSFFLPIIKEIANILISIFLPVFQQIEAYYYRFRIALQRVWNILSQRLGPYFKRISELLQEFNINLSSLMKDISAWIGKSLLKGLAFIIDAIGYIIEGFGAWKNLIATIQDALAKLLKNYLLPLIKGIEFLIDLIPGVDVNIKGKIEEWADKLQTAAEMERKMAENASLIAGAFHEAAEAVRNVADASLLTLKIGEVVKETLQSPKKTGAAGGGVLGSEAADTATRIAEAGKEAETNWAGVTYEVQSLSTWFEEVHKHIEENIRAAERLGSALANAASSLLEGDIGGAIQGLFRELEGIWGPRLRASIQNLFTPLFGLAGGAFAGGFLTPLIFTGVSSLLSTIFSPDKYKTQINFHQTIEINIGEGQISERAFWDSLVRYHIIPAMGRAGLVPETTGGAE